MQRTSLKIIARVSSMLLSIAVAAGCASSPLPEEKKTITILYSSIYDFKNDYGNFVQHKFNDVNIQIIEYESTLGDGHWNTLQFVPNSGEDWNSEAFIELVKQKKPDIVYFPVSIFPSLLEENILKDVSFYSNQSDIAEIDAPMIDTFRAMGGGGLYFLSDCFASQAIYYNKDLFTIYGVPEPNDLMNWNEILELSNMITRLGKEKGIIGLQTSQYSNSELLLELGKANHLSWYDANNQSVRFSSDSWKAVIEKIVQKGKSESEVHALAVNTSYSEWFAKGQIAMYLDTFKLKEDLSRNADKINWGLVTAPIVTNESNKSSLMTFQNLNGINNDTAQSEKALEVWAYLNSKNLARMKHNANYFRFTIPMRSNVIKDDEMRNLAAFYKLTPQLSLESAKRNVSLKVESAVKRYLEGSIQQMIAGDLSIADAVSKWELELPGIIKGAA